MPCAAQQSSYQSSTEPYPAGYCHFPEYGRDYFEGLASEKCVTEVIKYRARRRWIKVYERNEPLDVRVYARAAAALFGYDTLTAEDYKKMRTQIYFDQGVESQKVKDKKKSYKIVKRKGNYL